MQSSIEEKDIKIIIIIIDVPLGNVLVLLGTSVLKM